MAAKQYLNGSREGHVTLYKYDKYPWGAIGPVRFLWQQELCGDLGVENVDSSEEVLYINKLFVHGQLSVHSFILFICVIDSRSQLITLSPNFGCGPIQRAATKF